MHMALARASCRCARTTKTFAATVPFGAEDGFTVDGRPKTSDDFFVEVRRSVATGKALQTTVSLLVDRLPGDDGSGAVLYVDSIDFEVVPVKVAVLGK